MAVDDWYLALPASGGRCDHNGLALGYSLLLSLGVVDYARNTIRYYWGCPSGKVMAEDYSCVQPTFYPENRPSGEKRE